MKILAPVGNFECLKAAIAGGANEVYLGVKEFNARNNIEGFSLETLKSAIDYAHLFGVKVLLALNILFTGDEMQSAVDVAVSAYNYGIDAFIIQDLGLASILNKNYPQMELHASTQMGIHNLEGVKAIEKYGFKRVVLARETPLKEIKRIKENSDIEIEYFAHGALCVSFSGNCYLSSYLNSASGNRGKCKQLCRLPYKLVKGDKTLKEGYLLSAKDFDMTKRIKDLKDAGVDVLKIEGRARRAFYVYAATKQYALAINGKSIDYESLSLAFNRGFTEGYFNGNGNIISEKQNHIGVLAGKVIKVNNGKKFNEVFFSSSKDISPKSTLKFLNNGVEAATLTAYDITKINGGYRLTTTQNVGLGQEVRLLADGEKESVIQDIVNRRAVKVFVKAKVNENLTLIANVNGKEIIVVGEALEQAKNSPLSIDEIESNFKRNDYFNFEIERVDLEGVFIPKSQLNEFRRKVVNAVYNALTETGRAPLKSILVGELQRANALSDFQFIDKANEPLNAKNIIYTPETYSVEDVLTIKARCEKQNRNLYLDAPNFALKEDIDLLKAIIVKTGVKIVANNYYALVLNPSVIGAGLNVYNEFTANEFDLPIMTAESDFGSKIDYPFMTLRFCPMKAHLSSTCTNCKYQDGYSLKMDGGKTLKIKRKKLSSCTFYLTE